MKARSRVLSWSRVVLVDWDTTRLNISFLLVHWFEVVSCTGRLLLKCVFRTKPGWLFTCWLQQRGQLWLCYLVVFWEQTMFSTYGLYLDVDKTLSVLGHWQSFWECNFVVWMLKNAGKNWFWIFVSVDVFHTLSYTNIQKFWAFRSIFNCSHSDFVIIKEDLFCAITSIDFGLAAPRSASSCRTCSLVLKSFVRFKKLTTNLVRNAIWKVWQGLRYHF